ncbi:hypothetical protein BN874_970007 [Candidatus Contendobacter odensis Run_B_J11]|uniref:Uncharacterized protein n=1 Tax=Candidatus Contendobacter odensis Run_B_J11 TaxID=1400861 RepID=A0A7U7GGK1_9GAMM|nr:hypothetical protein BN874_970007 [Candidatus Contendobacter odensis Run_B_J11]
MFQSDKVELIGCRKTSDFRQDIDVFIFDRELRKKRVESLYGRFSDSRMALLPRRIF